MDNTNKGNDTLSVRCSYAQTLKALKQLLLAHEGGKHMQITAPKAPVMALLDELDTYIYRLADTPLSCDECPLMTRHNAVENARACVSRIARNAFGAHSSVTPDEADNLRTLFAEAYHEPVRSPEHL